MNQKVTLLLIALFCIFVKVSYSQIAENTPEPSATEYLRTVYVASLSEQSGLYDGPEYIGYPYPISVGQPFFHSEAQAKGEIYYNGILYKNVPMWYDLVKNEVVVQYLDNYSKISLHSPLISHFSLYEHLFARVDSSTARVHDIKEGFYDRIYIGKSEVVVKRSKGMLRTTNTEGVWITILNQKNEIYLIKDGRYYPVTSENSALKALGGTHTRHIQAQLKKSNIKFRKNPENAVVLMVSLYDQLSK